MTTLPLADVDALSRKACRLLGADQLAALAPSQRALLAFHLRDLLETRGVLTAVSPDDVRGVFEQIAGFTPMLREGGAADDAF